MIMAWIAYGILTSAVLSVAALAMERVCRIRRVATRWVWVSAMIAPFLLPLLTTTAESQVEASANTGAAVSNPQKRASTPLSASPSVLANALPRIDIAKQTPTWTRAADLNGTLLLIWAAVSICLAFVLLAGWLRLQRRSVSWTRKRIGGTEVLVAENVGPAVFGIIRSRIVAPMWLLDAEQRTQHAALAHENEHIAARDPLVLAATLLLVVLLPWNLPMWWQWRRLRFSVEVDCDARVLGSGHEAGEYGAALLDVAERRVNVPLLSPAMHDTDSSLERRIKLLLADQPLWPKSAATILIFCTLTFAVAAAQIAPPAQSVATQSAQNIDSRTQESADGPVRRALGQELLRAARQGDFEAAAALIDAGADIDHINLGDGTPLIAAARRGDHRLVDLLLQKGAASNLPCAGDGSPLIMAAAHGHANIVATLVEHGADVNGIVIGDETPLINASRGGHLPIVRFLVERGADVRLAVPADRSINAEIRSPLGEATKYGKRDVANYLRANGAA
jgi:beta-lactamase regulating signal transducer with metallopeptidase domain